MLPLIGLHDAVADGLDAVVTMILLLMWPLVTDGCLKLDDDGWRCRYAVAVSVAEFR